MASFLLSGDESGGFSDPALDLARHISVLNGTDPSSIDGKISDQKALDLALANLDKIISQAGEKSAERETVEGVLNVVCFLFQRVLENNTAPAEASKLVDAFLKKLSADTQHASIRLKTMASIYNILGGKGGARYSTMLAIIQYASSAGKAELAQVAPQCAGIDGMLSEWGSDVAKTRELYTAIYTAAAKHGNSADAHAFRLKFLNSFQGQPATPDALAQACIAVGEVIGNPSVFQFDDYLELDAVKALKNDAANASVYALLELFSSGDLKAFKEYYSKNEAVLKKLELNKDACVLKMRLLTLCSLGARQVSISYPEIASCLEVDESEVETWGIKAIEAKLMDAKLDQLQRCLIVSHCAARLFSQAHWATMRSKLVGWRERMQQLQQVIQATRARQQQELAMMSEDMQTVQ